MKVVLRGFVTGFGLFAGVPALLAQALPAAPTPAFPAPPPTAVAATPAPAPAPAPTPASDTNLLGKIAFATPIFDFGKIKSGEMVKHTYYFTNTGCGVLDVLNVQPSCGCTAAGEWTKKLEPGQTGTLAVQFNSANFNGPVLKTVTVHSNDKTQPQVILQLKGTIWRPVDVSPQFAVLNIPPDSAGTTATVTITNNTDEFVTLSPPESNNKAFTATLVTNTPGKGYSVQVSAVPPLTPGNLQGEITIKTSTTNMPVVSVRVWANVQPPMNILPPQVMLPPPPLGNKTTNFFNIQNNSTNALVISEPAFTLPGVEFFINENNPGRSFSVGLVFPTGFEIPAGQQAVFTAKTSSPQQPAIRVPVTQLPRPNLAQARPAPTPVPPPPVPPSQ